MERSAWRSIEAVNNLKVKHGARLRLLVHGQGCMAFD
jgi:hypothetical protein